MRFALAVLSLFLSVLPAFAKGGNEHMMDECLGVFGVRQEDGPETFALLSYISQGMDFGHGDKPVSLSQPGSSFLVTLRAKYPNFGGKHREYGHWGINGAIPKAMLEEFAVAYPDQKDGLVKIWRTFVVTRREATRLALGLDDSPTATKFAQAVAGLIMDIHILGDFTTKDTRVLMPLGAAISDIQSSLQPLLGKKAAEEFREKVYALPLDQTVAQRGQSVIDILAQGGYAERIGKNLRKVGYTGVVKAIDHEEVRRRAAIELTGKEPPVAASKPSNPPTPTDAPQGADAGK